MTTSGASSRPAEICIVGGGVAGLSLAHELSRDGASVDLCEASASLGGLAQSYDYGPFVWDRFYHCIVPTDRDLIDVLEEIGLASEIRWSSTTSGFLYRGRAHSLGTVSEFLRFSPLGWIDRMRLGFFVATCRRRFSGSRLEHESCSDFLKSTCGPRVWEVVWQPLLRAKLGPAAERISARFIWDSINRLHEARRGIQHREQLGYVAGGYGRILEAWTAHLARVGVKLRPASPVERLSPASGGGIEVHANGRRKVYDHVFLTLPLSASAALLPAPGHPRIRADGVEYLGVVVAGVVLRRQLTPYYILNISDPEIQLTGVIGTSNLVRDGTFGVHHFAYLPRYLAQDDAAWGRDDKDWAAWFLEQFRRAFPASTKEDVVSIHVAKARNVQPVLHTGYRDQMPPVDTGIPGIWLVNTSQCYQGPINVDLIVSHVRRTVREHGPFRSRRREPTP